MFYSENGNGLNLMAMDAEQLRENAHKMVDVIAEYYKNIESFPVLSQVEPGYLQKLIPDSAPVQPESLHTVLLDVETKILPGVTHWQSPNFFAYFPINGSIAGFLGEMLSAGINMMGPGGGVIQGTASEAVLVVLVAARDRILREIGKDALGKLVVYGSDQTHSCFQKACQIVGIHPQNLRLLRTENYNEYALSPESLDDAISHDIASGLIPFFLCATVGTTSSTAVDPLHALGKIIKRYRIWFHVDAAYAGSACICPEYRHHLNGIEEADSFNMNCHKWFLTNFDCSALWIKDRNTLIQSLSTNPEYLKNKASQGRTVIDYKDWEIPLGRRFRSLKLWMVLRLYGVENLQSYIRNHIKLAQQFEDLVAQDTRFEIVATRTFSLVCFRLLPPNKNEEYANKLNSDLLDAVNSSGKIFISHTVLSGNYILRFVVGAPLTEERHIVAAWKLFQEASSSLLENS
ncbi:hypothetical protein E3N88_22386 [Mikania micrantha]|uniref:Tyrosine decarboxylase n=1 Tax=Mikania micrantha TaxID=192012 RepID=A0A5N6NCZ5_9ASTR|nr:hypothetical protein E3N88_22386 [Mikania micrantha]